MTSSDTPLVEAMKEIRMWPIPPEYQSAHIDMLILTVLMDRYPGPEWILRLDRESRKIRVSRWQRLESHGTEMWSFVLNSNREIDCAELEAAGRGWLDLAKCRMA